MIPLFELLEDLRNVLRVVHANLPFRDENERFSIYCVLSASVYE